MDAFVSIADRDRPAELLTHKVGLHQAEPHPIFEQGHRSVVKIQFHAYTIPLATALSTDPVRAFWPAEAVSSAVKTVCVVTNTVVSQQL